MLSIVLAIMVKTILVRLSDSEYSDIETLVNDGAGRSKADFVKTAAILHIERCMFKPKNSRGIA